MNRIEFRVYGHPRPAGSKSAFIMPKKQPKPGQPGYDPRPIHEKCERDGKCLVHKLYWSAVTDASKHIAKWKAAVKKEARLWAPAKLIDGPVTMKAIFYMPRPKSHYGTGKNADVLKAKAPICHTIAPDALKLMRGTEDALTKVIYTDDCRVFDGGQRKEYHAEPGALITIEWEDE